MGNFFILTENNIFLGVVYNLHEEISMVKKYNSKCDFLINCFWWSNQLYSTNKVFLLKKTWLVIFHSVVTVYHCECGLNTSKLHSIYCVDIYNDRVVNVALCRCYT
jgi:hypothetical protein